MKDSLMRFVSRLMCCQRRRARWRLGAGARTITARGLLFVIAFLAWGLAAGCHICCKPPAQGVSDFASPKTARRAAMLSVYHYAYYAGDDWLPMEFRPVPLDNAAKILAADKGELAELRRRQAIVQLAAAPPSEARHAALTILGAPLEAIADVLVHESLFDRSKRQTAIAALLAKLFDPPTCQATQLGTTVNFDAATLITTVTASVTVNRKIADLAKVMDPQNWDVCSNFFDAAYVAKKVANDYPVDSNYDAIEDSAAPAAGSKWHGVLFENFAMSFDGINVAWFKNLLTIDFQPGATQHILTYQLFKSLRSRIVLLEQNDGITTDQGSAKAYQDPLDPGSSIVEGTKSIRLHAWPFDFWVNYWTSVNLMAMGDEMASSVCCTP